MGGGLVAARLTPRWRIVGQREWFPMARAALAALQEPTPGSLLTTPSGDFEWTGDTWERLTGPSSGAPEGEGLTEAWQDGFNAGVDESVLGEEGLTCGDHPDRKAIAQRGYCAECYRKFMEQGEGQLTAEESSPGVASESRPVRAKDSTEEAGELLRWLARGDLPAYDSAVAKLRALISSRDAPE